VGQPVSKEHLASPQGQVEVSAQWAGAEVTWALFDQGIVKPSLGVGARVVALQLRGVVATPLVGTSSRDYLVAPNLRARLTLQLTPEFHLFLDGSATWLLGTTRVALAGEPLGKVGPWLPSVSAGVELAVTD
jgi:hypothetical protein